MTIPSSGWSKDWRVEKEPPPARKGAGEGVTGGTGSFAEAERGAEEGRRGVMETVPGMKEEEKEAAGVDIWVMAVGFFGVGCGDEQEESARSKSGACLRVSEALCGFSLANRGSMVSRLRFSQPRFVLKVARARRDLRDCVI